MVVIVGCSCFVRIVDVLAHSFEFPLPFLSEDDNDHQNEPPNKKGIYN